MGLKPLFKSKKYLNYESSKIQQLNYMDLCFGIYSNKAPDSICNEDSCLLANIDQNTIVVAVADGLGGHKNGNLASATAINSLNKKLKNRPQELSVRESILAAIDDAHINIKKKVAGGGSTLCVAEIKPKSVRFYNVGDSQALIYSAQGHLKYNTLLDSPVGLALEAGLMKTEVAMAHESRHIIFNALGCDDLRIEVTSEIKRRKTDRILLATDGLLDNATIEQVYNEFFKNKDPQHYLDSLHEKMKNNTHKSKSDDLTVIYIKHKQFSRTTL